MLESGVSLGTDEPKAAKQREVKPRGRPKANTSVDEQLERIEGMLRGSAMLTCGIAARISIDDAKTIAEHTIAPNDYTPNLIAATMELCRQDPKVRAYMFGLAAQSAYLNVAVAAGSLIIGLMSNHKLVPPLFVPPSPKAPENGVSNGVSVMG